MEPYSKHTNLYADYYRTDIKSYVYRIFFYEQNLSSIALLDFDLRAEMIIDYHLCLYQTGDYERFLSGLDDVIDMVVLENIYTYAGKDIYIELLKRKGAALFNINEYNKALEIGKELRKIDSGKETATIVKYSIEKIASLKYYWLKVLGWITISTYAIIGLISNLTEDILKIDITDLFDPIRLCFLALGITCIIGREIAQYIESQKLQN